MPRVVLITGHTLLSKRKAGFHWLADAYWRAGWEVVFFTAAFSWLSRLSRDWRHRPDVMEQVNRIQWVKPRMGGFIWYTPFHPANLRSEMLNLLATPLFARYGRQNLHGAAELVAGADLLVFESTPGLLLVDRFRELAGGARTVYRVSDDLKLLRNHRTVLAAQERLAPTFDLVSLPSARMMGPFAGLNNVRVQPHGVRKELFDAAVSNPYESHWTHRAVFTGVSRLDTDFLHKAARLFPDWCFAVIGPFAYLPQLPNILALGELPFEHTVGYLRHADVGLHCLQGDDVGVFADSLKVLQYTYCRLPIVAPQTMQMDRPNVVTYRPGDEPSIRQALLAAIQINREQIDATGVWSWDDLAKAMLG